MPVAFVTGGTGFVGTHLVERLVGADWEVHALHRPGSDTSALDAAGVHKVVGGLLDPGLAIPSGADVVFHLAADTSIWRRHAERQLRTNIDGTDNIARQAAAAGAGRMVFVSSISAWGHVDGVITEQTPQHGKESKVTYCRSKQLAEERLHAVIDETGLDAVIVNPTHIMGPYDRGSWARLISMIDAGTLPGVPGGTGVFADGRRVAEGLVLAAEHGRSAENYIFGGPRASFLELAQIIGQVLGRKVPQKATPDALLHAVAFAKDAWSRISGREPDITPDGLHHVLLDLDVDDSKARETLGYRHTPLPDLISDTVDWMRETDKLG